MKSFRLDTEPEKVLPQKTFKEIMKEVEELRKKGKKLCPKCQKEVDLNEKVCPFCGLDFKKIEKLDTILKVMLVVIIPLIFIFLVYNFLSPSINFSSPSQTINDSTRCTYEIRENIKNQYKSPSTVDFVECKLIPN
jgi:uncharacterized paraquat-inducible protein A